MIITAHKRSLRRLCFLQLSVCPQGEGRAWQGGGVHGGGGGGCAWQGGMRAPRQILRDTVNERAVRILLCHLLHGNPLPPPYVDRRTDRHD